MGQAGFYHLNLLPYCYKNIILAGAEDQHIILFNPFQDQDGSTGIFFLSKCKFCHQNQSDPKQG